MRFWEGHEFTRAAGFLAALRRERPTHAIRNPGSTICGPLDPSLELPRPRRHHVSLRIRCRADLAHSGESPERSIWDGRRQRSSAQVFRTRTSSLSQSELPTPRCAARNLQRRPLLRKSERHKDRRVHGTGRKSESSKSRSQLHLRKRIVPSVLRYLCWPAATPVEAVQIKPCSTTWLSRKYPTTSPLAFIPETTVVIAPGKESVCTTLFRQTKPTTPVNAW